MRPGRRTGSYRHLPRFTLSPLPPVPCELEQCRFRSDRSGKFGASCAEGAVRLLGQATGSARPPRLAGLRLQRRPDIVVDSERCWQWKDEDDPQRSVDRGVISAPHRRTGLGRGWRGDPRREPRCMALHRGLARLASREGLAHPQRSRVWLHGECPLSPAPGRQANRGPSTRERSPRAVSGV